MTYHFDSRCDFCRREETIVLKDFGGKGAKETRAVGGESYHYQCGDLNIQIKLEKNEGELERRIICHQCLQSAACEAEYVSI